jgi:hypothetical protein
MAQPAQEPGAGRSTSSTTFNDLKKAIAQRNDLAHKAARKLRSAREREQTLRRRRQDLL